MNVRRTSRHVAFFVLYQIYTSTPAYQVRRIASLIVYTHRFGTIFGFQMYIRNDEAMVRWIDIAKQWARTLRRDVIALWIGARDPRTPLAAKLVAGAVAAYALSPIDLVPDFIPILGYLDDLLIVPLGIMLAVRLVPAPLMAEYRAAALLLEQRPTSRAGFAVILAIWALFLVLLTWFVRSRFP